MSKHPQCTCCGQSDLHVSVTLSGKEVSTCRECDSSVTFDWIKAGAVDCSEYARGCGYALEMPVLVHDDKVVSYQSQDWFDFLRSCRRGEYAVNGLRDDMSWQTEARQCLTQICKAEYDILQNEAKRKGRTLRVVRYSDYANKLQRALCRNDCVGFEQTRRLQGYTSALSA